MTALRLGCVATLFGLSLSAQSAPRPTPPRAGSTVEGDVFVMTKGGDLKRGAGLQVYLLPVGVKLEAAKKSACHAFETAEPSAADVRENARMIYEIKGATDLSAALRLTELQIERMRNRLDEKLDLVREAMYATAVTRAGTGINAHFRFGAVPPGEYLIATHWKLMDQREEWLTRATVKTGVPLKLDLDHNNRIVHEDRRELYCPSDKSKD